MREEDLLTLLQQGKIAEFDELRRKHRWKPIDLRGANFWDANLTGANLTGANLTRANLTRANLTGANLTRANLTGANLTRANLTGANLPEHIPVVKNFFTRLMEIIEQDSEALNMCDWHTCETTHCMAGWAIQLAGEAGLVAESFAGTQYAGALIINASCPCLKGVVPDFFASNDDALKFIKECAEKEKELV